MAHEMFQLARVGAVNVVDLVLPPMVDTQDLDSLIEALLVQINQEPGGRWVVDLSRLEYMGSASLGLLVNIRQKVKESNGTLVLCGMSVRLMQIFKTCCMDRLFKTVKSRQDAINIV